jgi:diacylglycerol O-acyltransferase / wax synthase
VSEQLSPADRSSLQAERGPINMAVGGVLVFEAGDGTEHDAVAQRLQSRLHLVPRYRQRIEPGPLGVTHPVWVDDGGFDINWHLRRAVVGDRAGLEDYVGREMSRRLDRSRPLWEVHVIEGLEEGRRALWIKMHHALVDGLAAVGVGMLMLDPTPEPMELPAPDGDWNPRSYGTRDQLARLAKLPIMRAQRLVLDTTMRALDTSPRKAAEDLRRATELFAELARTRPQAPMTPLNEPISPNRRYAMLSAELAPLKAAGKAAGGSVNDAILAAVSGMLQHFLHEAHPLVALVPVSVRREDEKGDLGNRISTVFVDLPVDIADPQERIRSINVQMKALRESAAVRAGALIVGATGLAPPLVSAALVRAMGNVRAFNLVVSNVPGPQQPFYLNGTRLLEVHPAVPLNPGNQGLSVGVLSYDGGVHFGLLADQRIDVEAARDALAGELAALTA